MEERLEEKKCANPGCNCPARDDSDYCCESCKNAHGMTDCECGHPECK